MTSESATPTSGNSERSFQLAFAAARCAADNRGQQIVILDLRDVTPVFDYFVIVTGTSGRQLRSMSEDIDNVLEKQLVDKRMGVEGFQDSRWILLDYGTVVIHLFDAEMRAYYDLEHLWSAGKSVDLRRLNVRAPVASHIAVTQIVDEKQNDVRFARIALVLVIGEDNDRVLLFGADIYNGYKIDLPFGLYSVFVFILDPTAPDIFNAEIYAIGLPNAEKINLTGIGSIDVENYNDIWNLVDTSPVQITNNQPS